MRTFFLLLSVFSPFFLLAQTDTANKPKSVSKWETNLETGLNITQASYSGNWKAGGINSISLGTFLNAKSVRKTEQNEWTNDLQLLYGTVKNEGQDLRKNADRIFFDSKFSHKISNYWNLFTSVNCMSQFDAGFEYKLVNGAEQSKRISAFLSPGYLTEALGFEYKPVNYFSAQFGLGALRQTFVTDQQLYNTYSSTAKEFNELYGVKRGANMRNQIVFQTVFNFDKEVMENLKIKARYMGLLDYDRLSAKYIVSRLDISITAKVNKYISTNLNGVLLYDFDQDKDIQYSQVISLGVMYTFSNTSK